MALALAFVGVFSSAALGGDVSLVALSGVLSGPLALAGIVSGPLALAGGVFSGLASVSSVSVSGLSALALFAVAPVSAAPAQSSSWDGAILEHSRPVGDAQTGSFFRVVGHAGSVVEKLHIWRNAGKDQYIRGLQLFFSDGSSQVAGVLKSQHTEVRLEDGAHIVEMTMWVSKSRIARVALRTSAGQDFAAGFDVHAAENLDSVPVSVGSGILVGFEGKVSDGISLLKAVCLKKLSESRVDSVELQAFGKTQGLELSTLKEGHADWNGTDYNFEFSGTEKHDRSTSWSMSSSNSLSLGMSINFAIPMITGASASASWSASSTTSNSISESRSEEDHWGVSFAVKAPTTCVAKVWRGRLDNLRWNGRHTLVTTDGATASFPTTGRMSRKDSGKVTVHCYADGEPNTPIALHRLFD
ncbi:hypothetical protein BT67DRAFT_377803 [Trichocladium antarcticum]|uniref:Jacalin-type lectin domain-containing protein n=1 Tax=Trichocladium antarcticum TaxID=1450529 RepID=A0AAN6UMP7_9PEZI|nr:hypothetical protein BT67DRAFT_377803 [Trichocladium antarcticum]